MSQDVVKDTSDTERDVCQTRRPSDTPLIGVLRTWCWRKEVCVCERHSVCGVYNTPNVETESRGPWKGTRGGGGEGTKPQPHCVSLVTCLSPISISVRSSSPPPRPGQTSPGSWLEPAAGSRRCPVTPQAHHELPEAGSLPLLPGHWGDSEPTSPDPGSMVFPDVARLSCPSGRPRPSDPVAPQTSVSRFSPQEGRPRFPRGAHSSRLPPHSLACAEGRRRFDHRGGGGSTWPRGTQKETNE